MIKNIKYGIIGCGMMGQEHIKNILYLQKQNINCFIEAICDTNKDSINKTIEILKKNQNRVKIYSNYQDLIKDLNINIVVIAVPNYIHFEILNFAIHNKKNILVENPICIHITDIIQVYNLLQKNNFLNDHLLWIGYQYIYNKSFEEVIKILGDNKIGKIKMISLKEHGYPLLSKVDSWNTEIKKTGGLLIEKCCHFFHILYLLSNSKPISVYASGNLDTNHLNKYIDDNPTKLIDNAFIIVNFENGIRACLEICLFSDGSKHQTELSVIGNKGKIECFIPSNKIVISNRPNQGNYTISYDPPEKEDNNINKYKLQTDNDLEQIGLYNGSIYWQHLNIINSIFFKKKSRVDYKQGLVSLIISIAAQESIDKNKLIYISDLIKNDNLIKDISEINF